MEEEKREADGEFSILDPRGKPDRRRELPAFFRDLNLETVLERLALEWGQSVKRYFEYLPETAEDVAYRRAVYGDVRREAVYGALTAFLERLADAEEMRREKGKAPDARQRAVWQLRETEAYCDACEELASALEEAEPASEGMRRLCAVLRAFLSGAEYRLLRERVKEIMDRIRGLRLVITYEKDRIRVATGESGEEYEPLAGRGAAPIRNPFASGPALTEMESTCLDLVIRKEPEFLRGLAEASERCERMDKGALGQFEKEIRFYLSYCALQREMEGAGFRFSVPESCQDRPMEGKGVYDLALACAFRISGKRVVANDFYYADTERFFVVTGPNQGGKTTFARSLGQLVYFARIGLDVPAAEANVPFFRDIQTHFSVEESVETGRGKLKEELVRLAPMMEEMRRGTFVVINELFTTAASHDALIMGRRVLEHFIALDCMGIYVTHLKELSSVSEKAVSLRATLDEEGRATYRILRGGAEDAACAGNIVKKYRLTYEQLKERL